LTAVQRLAPRVEATVEQSAVQRAPGEPAPPEPLGKWEERRLPALSKAKPRRAARAVMVAQPRPAQAQLLRAVPAAEAAQAVVAEDRCAWSGVEAPNAEVVVAVRFVPAIPGAWIPPVGGCRPWDGRRGSRKKQSGAAPKMRCRLPLLRRHSCLDGSKRPAVWPA
jgi:hypothetical protein